MDKNERMAVKATIKMMNLGVKKPELVFLYSTVSYYVKVVLRYLRMELGRLTSIYGLTSWYMDAQQQTILSL
ncbi:MAG: hypothetical protein SV375_17655 [Thermodesulfobacteriota bacterium]|nr:hypothetical protein [Thermodesulfobacteriota bacterium]